LNEPKARKLLMLGVNLKYKKEEATPMAPLLLLIKYWIKTRRN
jgi:hypothetical protein